MQVKLVYSVKDKERVSIKALFMGEYTGQDGAFVVMCSPSLMTALAIGIGSRVQVGTVEKTVNCSVVFLDNELKKMLKEHEKEHYLILGGAVVGELNLKRSDEKGLFLKYPPVFIGNM